MTQVSQNVVNVTNYQAEPSSIIPEFAEIGRLLYLSGLEGTVTFGELYSSLRYSLRKEICGLEEYNKFWLRNYLFNVAGGVLDDDYVEVSMDTANFGLIADSIYFKPIEDDTEITITRK